MPIEHHVRQLVEDALDTNRTPDEVCRDCPELLAEVHRQWERVLAVDHQLDALFPSDESAFRDRQTGLPQIEGHELEAVIGQGGMGVVYRARHRKLNRPVALKMILAGAYASLSDRARFQREAEAVAALRHPNVVQVYDSGEADGRPYFTMELVEGGTLATKLGGTPLCARPAAELVAALAGAVQAAHANGIIHRDLKPANVLLTDDGTPRVADFGLARYVEDGPGLTLSGARVGTPSYMAPEQALGQSNAIGPATDIYALGAILYELLTGRPPFKGESAAETERQVIAIDPVPPSRLNTQVPRDLETICLKCLRKEPQLRYASAADLAEDLHHFLRGEAISARPERWAGRLARRIRRRPAFSAAVAVGTLVAFALLACSLWLVIDRVAAAREIAAERAATRRAATNDDLQEMIRWLKQSSWPEARAALERAKTRLEERVPEDLRRLMDQGTHDLTMGTKVEDTRLNAFESTDTRYEEVFSEFGGIHDDTDIVAGRIAASNICDALVAALDHWSVLTADPQRRKWALEVARKADPNPTSWRIRARDVSIRNDEAALLQLMSTAPVADRAVSLLLALEQQLNPTSPEHIRFLKRVQHAHPSDFWVNYRLAVALRFSEKPEEAIGYYQTALAARPGSPQVRSGFGTVLVRTGRGQEGLEECRQAVRLDPTFGGYRMDLCNCLHLLHRYDELIKELPSAIEMNPEAAMLHTAFGRALEAKGRFDEALDQHRKAVALDPKRAEAQKELRDFLMRRRNLSEARVAWNAWIEASPLDHEIHYGYAEFCLFLGQDEQYRLARTDLLSKFGSTADPYIAERVARACLLMPASGEELRQAVTLAGRATAVPPSKLAGGYPFFLFAQGLAEYRQKKFEHAIATMRGPASQVLGPAPRLVLAMALYQSGEVEEARKALSAAIKNFDWSAEKTRDQDDWIRIVLRREAEQLIK